MEVFGRFRVAFWAFSAGLVGLYVYGLVWRAYSPLELGGGVLSIICLTLLVLFIFHEVTCAGRCACTGTTRTTPTGSAAASSPGAR